MLSKDYLVKGITKNGAFRVTVVLTRHLTEEARQKHNLSHTATVALGRSFACGILLCSTLKKIKGSLTFKIRGSGPLGVILVEANTIGTVRGYVANPTVECFDKNGYISVSQAVGKNGTIEVIYSTQKGFPYKGSTEIVTGEIADDVVNYLAVSEQINSFLSCGVYIDPKGNNISHAGGILIQRMPEATEEDIELLEETVSKLDPFTILLRSNLSVEDIIKKAFKGFEVEIFSDYENICFNCDCSKERFKNALSTLKKTEVQDIIEKVGYAEGKCHFCNATYTLSKKELGF